MAIVKHKAKNHCSFTVELDLVVLYFLLLLGDHGNHLAKEPKFY